MFSKAFSTPSRANWVIQGAGLIWLLVTASILNYYGLSLALAFTDALVYALAFLGGVVVLDRIFSFYIPKGANTWLLLILPLILSLIGTLLHRYVGAWIFEEDDLYRKLLGDHFYLRWAILAIMEAMVTLLAIVVSKLEQQEASQKRELHIMELSKEAELTQLRQQLQPHFLFNSLNSINALVVSESKKAREMVLQLSDFLRGTIRKDHQTWISLEEELAYLKLYLEIEKVRFGHRLQVEFEVSEEASQMQLPQLLIQPLLENAIKHGLYGITGEVNILIKAAKKQNYLIIMIENPYDPETPAQDGTGFGLSSVERRLYLLFGRNDLLTKEAKNSTFSIELKIPQLK
ncbi:sensor histidine kinase [Algoriphagus hitonicola]|uniref:Histidine kinase n=1 Tax=Algoriphagus hitonicola TaxID=435880 RepID=A0A1I2WDE7_9BACT|nr:histidine kinase [Algoriphagus hitonicola]SFG98739.1 Histidine kinase [Algoriphagus hitonicola]